MAAYDMDDGVPSDRIIRSYRDFVKDLRAKRPKRSGYYNDCKPDSFFQEPVQENDMAVTSINKSVENRNEIFDNTDDFSLTPEQQTRVDEAISSIEEREAAFRQNEKNLLKVRLAFIQAVEKAGEGDDKSQSYIEGLNYNLDEDMLEFERRVCHDMAETLSRQVTSNGWKRAGLLAGSVVIGAAIGWFLSTTYTEYAED